MKRVIAFAGYLAAFGAASAFGATVTVTVQDTNGNTIPSAQVAAVRSFPGGNFDPNATVLQTTLANGATTMTTVDTDFYDFYASSQGYAPTFVGQFNDPNHPAFATNGAAPPVTIVLSTVGVANVGAIQVRVTNAISPILSFTLTFANGSYTRPIGYGMGTSAGGFILNVPATGGGIYNVTIFDPLGGTNGNGLRLVQNVASAVVAGNVLVLPIADMNSALPPPTTVNNFQPTGGSNGSVSGIVTDTTTAHNAIPYIGLNFYYQKFDQFGCQQGCTQNVWTNSDTNGLFQLFGLNPGTTYYGSAQGGCFCSGNNCGNGSTCYTGFTSTAVNTTSQNISIDTTSVGPNDFLFVSSSAVLTKNIRMNFASGGSGTMAVYVKDSNGNSMPQSGVGLWPDWARWDVCGSANPCPNLNGPPPQSTCAVSNQGFAQFNGQATTGYIQINSLLPGNYQLNIWNGFTQAGSGFNFNSGTNTASGNGNFGPNGPPYAQCGNGGYRLTITTTTPGHNVNIYNSFGDPVLVNGTSVTVVMTLSTAGLNGVLSGSIQFTGLSGNASTVDLSQNPISLTLQPQCFGQCNGGGNFIVFNSSVQPVNSNYTLNVATGNTYFSNLSSTYWGLIRANGGGNNNIDFSVGNSANFNMTFAPAGRWLGKLYKPDGSVFTLSNNNNSTWVNVNAEGNNSWGWGQLNNDGTFVIGGLLPGKYGGQAQGNGSGWNYTQALPLPSISVTANQDTYQDVNLVAGVNVTVNVDTNTLPPIPQFNCGNKQGNGDCPPQGWSVHHLPAGSPITQDVFREFMDIKANGNSDDFKYFASSGPSGCSGPQPAPGFCTRSEADQTFMDLYLLREGHFDSGGLDNPSPDYPSFVILASSKNVAINSSLTSQFFQPDCCGGPGSTIAVENIKINPRSNLRNATQATLKGNVTAQNFIRQVDFNALGGDFNHFLAYIPLIGIFNSSGTLVAGGSSVPNPPTCFSQNTNACGPTMTIDNCFNQLVSSGSWTGFSAFFQGLACLNPTGYEIRGLTPGQTYTMVVTSPNYPPYKTTVTMDSVNGSTTTLNINLDQSAGTGASISGVITDTATVGNPIVGAAVTVQSQGYGTRSVPTDATGHFRLDGLPTGAFKVTVVAAGYAQRATVINIVSAILYTQNFALPTGPGVITGKVVDAETGLPVSANIYAYNDTINAASSGTATLAVYQTATSSVGVYNLTGLEPNSIYKIYAKGSSIYKIAQTSATATAGTVTGINIRLLTRPFAIEASGYPLATGNFYEFVIDNPSQFVSGSAQIGDNPFVLAASTDVTQAFQQRTLSDGSKELILDYPIVALGATAHILHISAQYYDQNGFLNTATQNISFDATTPGASNQNIDSQIIGDDSNNAQGLPNNLAVLDPSGSNGSGIGIPAGALIPNSGGQEPSLLFSAAAPNVNNVARLAAITNPPLSSFASSIYTAILSSVSYTNTGIDITLAYNQTGSSLSDLAIYTLENGSWIPVPGTQTIDPLKGTITVKNVKSLSSVLGLPKNHPMRALSDGRSFRPNSIALAALGLRPDDTGVFAIMKPSLVGGAFTGTVIKIYNFPNPFNLSQKTVTLANPGTLAVNQTINGTMIKIELPASAGGDGILRIYDVAGELVRQMDLGPLSGGSFNYAQWDGKNKNGVGVANGVYYGILSVPGVHIKDATFKMAVIK